MRQIKGGGRAAFPVQVGDVVRRTPESMKTDKGTCDAAYGRVVYVHPFGRYHTVAFETKGGSIRESFFGTAK